MDYWYSFVGIIIAVVASWLGIIKYCLARNIVGARMAYGFFAVILILSLTVAGYTLSCIPKNTNSNLLDEKVAEPSSVQESFVESEEIEPTISEAVGFVAPNLLENSPPNTTILAIDPEILSDIFFLESAFAKLPENMDEYLAKSHVIVEEHISLISNKKQKPTDNILISNNQFCQLTEKANAIDQRNQIENKKSNYYEAVSVRQKAYEIIPCPQITFQLARNYTELAMYCNAEDKNELFENAIKAVNNLEETLSFSEYRTNSRGDIYYRLGQLYHLMGDQAVFDKDIRAESYVLASVYYSMAQDSNSELYDIMDSYYCGMVNHKLGIISKENNSIFLLKANNHYKQVLQSKGQLKPITISDTYSYLANVNECLANFVIKYGKGTTLQSAQKYREIAANYSQQIKY